jgi:hypothetical protein
MHSFDASTMVQCLGYRSNVADKIVRQLTSRHKVQRYDKPFEKPLVIPSQMSMSPFCEYEVELVRHPTDHKKELQRVV